MRVKCPHCRHAIEFVDDATLSALSCPSCGSTFNLLTDRLTLTQARATIQRIDRFELIERVGIGAFGTVWKARDAHLDRFVAVKLPRKQDLDQEELGQFLREAQSAAQLGHPNIVTVHEVGIENETIYIVSDFVEGQTLSAVLKTRSFRFDDAARLCRTIARAVHHAHENGVVHRDLKPGNIMLDAEGEPHVMDFGLAKRDAGEITVTLDGRVLGTPAYMSPEQARGQAYSADARSDIYSLGVILFELLTGERPFSGTTRVLIEQVINEDPPSPRRKNRGIPRDLETICLKCLHKQPARRYDSSAALADDLDRYLSHRPIQARPVGMPERAWLWCRRRPTLVAAIVALFLLTFLAMTAMVAQQAANQRRLASQRESNTQRLAQSRVDALLSAPAEAVGQAIEQLEPLGETATPLLRNVWEDPAADPVRQLRAAFALASRELLPANLLVEQIEKASADECSNFVAVLGKMSGDILPLLQQRAATARAQGNESLTFRLAIVALHLGDDSVAADLCQPRPDPALRTSFIGSMKEWHGDLVQLAKSVGRFEDPALQSALALGIGDVPRDRRSAADTTAWNDVWSNWYRTAPVASVHSASEWALRKWDLDLPEIPASPEPVAGMQWHINRQGMTMSLIPPGKLLRFYAQRDPDDLEKRERKLQTVNLTKSFLLSSMEVTTRLFRQFVEDPEYSDAEKPLNWPGADPAVSPTEGYPVQMIRWHEAALFCNWLSQKEGLSPCYRRTGEVHSSLGGDVEILELVADANGYRLPTEAEWEYACRAGSETYFSFGDDQRFLSEYAVQQSDATDLPGSRKPNVWGLFDLHGNVAEFCHDWYAKYPQVDQLDDPSGPPRIAAVEIAGHIVRGGSFNAMSSLGVLNLKSETRGNSNPLFRQKDVGFRVARTHGRSP